MNIVRINSKLNIWKEAKKYWEELVEGKYQWSGIEKQLLEKGLVK